MDSTELAVSFGFGIEFEVSEAAFARTAFEYLTYDNVDEYNFVGMYGYGFTERSLGAARLE